MRAASDHPRDQTSQPTDDDQQPGRHVTRYLRVPAFLHAARSRRLDFQAATFEKREQQLKESCFLDFEKKRKKRPYSFSGHLVTRVFDAQLPKVSTGKSPTSNMLLCCCQPNFYFQKASCLEILVTNPDELR